MGGNKSFFVISLRVSGFRLRSNKISGIEQIEVASLVKGSAFIQIENRCLKSDGNASAWIVQLYEELVKLWKESLMYTGYFSGMLQWIQNSVWISKGRC